MKPSCSPCTDRTARAEVYRKAAKMLEDRQCVSWFSCHAILQAMHGGSWPLREGVTFDPSDYPEVAAYGELMRPHADVSASRWFDGWDIEEHQSQRILMLCFMAEMVEAGDVP